MSTTKTAVPKTVLAVLEAAVKKIQRSNTWTVSQDVKYHTDSEGKTRRSFCARGAVCAVLAGSGDALAIDAAKRTNRYNRVERSLEKTIKQVTGQDTALTSFNDKYDTNHAGVVKIFRDTISRLKKD